MSSVITPEWDLSDLYRSLTDPQIPLDQQELSKLSSGFIKKYKNQLNPHYISPPKFKIALDQYTQILEKAQILASYGQLLHSKNTLDEKIGHLYQSLNEFITTLDSNLLWFELEILNLPQPVIKLLINDPILKKYHHYLSQILALKPHRLLENEEKIIVKQSQAGSEAFVRLYDQSSSRLLFPLKINNQKKLLSLSELTPYLTTYKDRSIRRQASQSVTTVLHQNSPLFTFIFNTLLLNKKINDEIHHYSFPQQATYLAYEILPETVNNLTQIVTQNYPLVERFYKAKKKLLHLDSLYEYDRYSLISPHQAHYSWNEAKQIILSAFSAFSPEFSRLASLFFKNQWIDAKITPNKVNGAFCSYVVPSKHPYLLLNFSGQATDVLTLAHELGHAIHGYLARQNNLLEFDSSIVVAEVASIFAEMLVFQNLYHQLSDKSQKINLLATKIQESFATIFRQNAFFLFEQAVHRLRQDQGELTCRQINQLFQSHLQAMFGRGLTLSEGHQYWWIPVLHFYHYHFYVFSYAFGESLTNSLYSQYLKAGSDFIKNYLEALSAGGSLDPYQLTTNMGFDIRKPSFWQQGIDLLEQSVTEFEKLSAAV